MAALSVQMGQFWTILIMAIALGMDAFSLGIGIGMRGVRVVEVIRISVVIAVFHIVMPLMGMFMGHYVSTFLGDVATMTGGGLLLLLGIHMVYSSLRGDSMPSFDYRSGVGVLIFALSVSIDSFSVGVSLGLFATDLLLTVILFGAFGGIMSVVGLLLGRRVNRLLGEYGEAFGGIILCAFGLKFLI